MSWSIQKTVGAPDKVRAAIEPLFDQAAKCYAGKTEEQDVLSAKATVLAFLDEFQPPMPNYGVSVEASGSRGGTWCNVTIACWYVILHV